MKKIKIEKTENKHSKKCKAWAQWEKEKNREWIL